MVFTAPWKQIEVRKVTERLHHDAEAAEIGERVGVGVIMSTMLMISIFVNRLLNCEFLSILLDVPDETTFLCIAWATDMKMVLKHDVLRFPGRIILSARVQQEVHLFVGVQDTIRDAVLIEIRVYN